MSKLFPIMGIGYRYDEEIREHRAAGVGAIVIGIPWEMIQPHEKQAQSNHGQTLTRLAERGGLSACEALAILSGRRYERMTKASATRELAEKVAQFLASSPEVTRQGGSDNG